MSEPLLRVEKLEQAYGGPAVLRGVDLELDRGQGLALLGPNGAGKSTLLRVLAGLQKPGRGRIDLDGRRFRPANPEHRRRIGFVSHESLLYDGLTARENLHFFAKLFSLPSPVDRSEEVLRRVGLEWVGERPVRTFSRGMLQRLTLARALLHDPVLLLLDEPMTGLDPVGRSMLEERLAEVRARGAALLITTHELTGVRAVADRVAFLRRGRIAEQGSIAEYPAEVLEARFRELFAPKEAPR